MRTKPDTATSVEVKLCDLPIDLLDPITAHLHYLDVANLAFIGCTALNMKLANGGVSQLTVQMLPGLKPFCWPSLWTQATQLAKLTLSNWKISEAPITTSEMLLLPRKLKELRIDCASAFSAMQQVLSQNPDLFSTLELLEIQTCANDTHLEEVVPLWPRSLVSLTLNSPNRLLLPLHLHLLPPSLTYLKGEFREIRNSPSAAFPQSLTALSLRVHNLGCDPVPLLPIGLRSLDVVINSDFGSDWREKSGKTHEWAVNSLPQLPRGLTLLNWPVRSYTRESLQHLPPLLETLEFGTINPEDWTFLPPSITSCIACASDERPAVMDSVQHIPPALKQFAVTTRALPHLKLKSKNGVCVRVCGQNYELKEEMAAVNMERLDSGITSLICVSSLGQFPLDVLPGNLTHLLLGQIILEEECISMLPQTLRRLELPRAKVQEETWKLLPKRLEALALTLPGPLSVESASWLPRTLTRLLTLASVPGIPLAWFDGLPRGLQNLSMHLYLDGIPTGPIASPPYISLPPSLTCVYFQMRTESKESIPTSERLKNLVASLPPDLESFSAYIANSPRVTIPFRLLPRRLTRLSLPRELQIERD